MKTPTPINQAEIDEIIAIYDKKIAEEPTKESLYRIQCQSDVAKAIGRQRQEAIAAGGELAQRIKEENEAMMLEAQAALADISPEVLESIKDREAKMKNLMKNDTEDESISISDVCQNCGAKVSNTAKFCEHCGSKIER